MSQQEVLTSMQMYRSEVFSTPRLSPDEEIEMIDRARQGDEQARNRLIEDCLRYVMVLANHYKRYVYHDTYLDLIGIGNLAVVEDLDKALTAKNPCAHLRSMAKYALIQYCFRRAGLIMKTYQEVDSLNVPVYGDDAVALVDRLIASEPEPEQRDYSQLYQVLDQLTSEERELLARHYGLYGMPAESLYAISRELSKKPGPKSSMAYKREYRILDKLRQWLEQQPNSAA